MKYLMVMLIFMLMVPACIDPLNFSKDSDSGNLVVDGLITDRPGPYRVRLTRTAAYHNLGSGTEYVNGAVVRIMDHMGNMEQLKQTNRGIYETSVGGIRGVPGRYYTLEIETSDGQLYTSVPELLQPVSKIDSIYYEKGEQEVLTADGDVSVFEGFRIYIDTSDPGENRNYYRLIWKGTHEVHTQPWDYIDSKIIGKDCCATCWTTDVPESIDVYDDTFFNGKKVRKYPVNFVRIYDRLSVRHFRGKYHVEVKQMSLTKAAHDYWERVSTQLTGSGSIFEPPPSVISGNIVNTTDPEEIVIGYFGASGVSSKALFIPETEAAYDENDTLVFPDDCRKYGFLSTAEKPSFW